MNLPIGYRRFIIVLLTVIGMMAGLLVAIFMKLDTITGLIVTPVCGGVVGVVFAYCGFDPLAKKYSSVDRGGKDST